MVRQDINQTIIRFFYISFFLFLLHRIFFISTGMVEKTASYVLYPFLKIHTSIDYFMHQHKENKKTIEDLRRELQVLSIAHSLTKARVAQLEAQQVFIEQSQEVVDFAQRYEHSQKTIAKVLFYYHSSLEDVMFIDGGFDKGFNKDDIVVFQNALIGRIIEVYPWYSKIALITDSRCRISVTIGTDISGIACGKNNNIIDLMFIPHYKNVAVGNLVISTGQGLVYPQGFAIGIVESVKTDSVSHSIRVKPYVSINNIFYVYVFKKIEKTSVALSQETSDDYEENA